MQQNEPLRFDELLAGARRAAIHLEMRDGYAVPDEADDYRRWRETGERDVDPTSPYWAPWVEMVRAATARGVVMRRVRIVSEPVSEYIRYEHAGTVVNAHAGEEVRWLPRDQAVGLLLPAVDGWLFDDERLLLNHFDGDGRWRDRPMELRTEPVLVRAYADAVEAVWDRAVPHDRYEIR
ncbi:hypothetical protein DEJ44_19440 [Streptomyces venezuelae]|uniref:DUF6879 family protein n=1 Tax=Streptomyces venezuelae TaxID=54571 RepID=UPI0012385CD5|nr:DUF6879 family protein [Streptomyces venezuelae]QES07562.1 hypothetical protein DEJ44_19440 [Streptomyces venezuelae]